jgi:hypothetical protein
MVFEDFLLLLRLLEMEFLAVLLTSDSFAFTLFFDIQNIQELLPKMIVIWRIIRPVLFSIT